MTEGQAPEQQKKKGLGTLAWIGIGCGALLLIMLIAMGACGIFVANVAKDSLETIKDVAEDFSENPAAELVVRVNPEIELVESDREAGRITIREKSSGKVLTFTYEDISEGRFSFEGEDGEALRIDASGATNGEATITLESEDGTTTVVTVEQKEKEPED